jgi:release factor glutamine methyltransferase
MNNIQTALQKAYSILEPCSEEPKTDAQILLCQVLNKNRAYLFAHPEQDLNEEQCSAYQNAVAERAKGKPIAYITGTRDFWSLSLRVNQHTLIPRHETELLVELALKFIPNAPNTQVLDLGTGSGAIALALAKERPHWQIDACDQCEHALSIARENAQSNELTNVRFYHSDWFSQLPKKHYHALVSNPPYLAPNDPHLQKADLRFEPQSALVSSQDGLADLQYLIAQGYNQLLPNGLILVEHGYEQKKPILAILERSGYRSNKCWKDIHGHDRVSGGFRRP